MSRVYDEDWEVPDEDPFTLDELRYARYAVLCTTTMFAWWTRHYIGVALAIVMAGASVSIWLSIYQFLLEEDRRDEEDHYGWEEDDE